MQIGGGLYDNIIILIDEIFLYWFKDVEIDKNNKFIRRAYKYFKLSDIETVEIKNLDKGKVCFEIYIVFDRDVSNYKAKLKKFYFENNNAVLFLKYLKFYIKQMKIPIIIK